MLRKITFLAIALLAIGLTVVQAQQGVDMRRLEALERELEQLESKVDRGQQLTPQEIQRMTQIQQEILQAMGSYGEMYQFPPQGNPGTNDGDRQVRQIEQMQRQALQQGQNMQPQQQQPQQLGQNAGWPPASAFQGRFRITPLRQPAGTTARYDAFENNGVIHTLEIYISGGNANAALEDLKRQIEAITRQQMSHEGNAFYGFTPDPNSSRNDGRIRFILELENNVVKFSIDTVAG